MLLAAWADFAVADTPPYERLQDALPRYEQIAEMWASFTGSERFQRVTAKGKESDIVLGLGVGADDYVPKPCNPRELLARIRAVMRRAPSAADDEHHFVQDDLVLNQGNRTLTRDGRAVDLTSTEFSILLELLQHRGDVVSKRDLYVSALGREPVPHDRSVDMHVSNLRRKLGPDPRGENRIETIRGIGYQYRIS